MINYPNGKKQKNTTDKTLSATNRGMTLENDINLSNDFYLEVEKANIHKKPTPVQIVTVDYPKRSAAKISEAYFKVPSTTDYNGVYKGKAIDFEAKECSSKTSFPFSSIHPHQIKHLKSVLSHGAIAFVIIRFSKYNETYFVEAHKVIEAYSGEKRSLPYDWFKQEAILIPTGLCPRVDYLKVIDQLYLGGQK
ncbi:Holliday junction resolvase RecU [Anaerorhabdus furcosa]|uniref:Holliday junction resolvase RecU n=1 Tax=Anaerorhabdus furcosa TaxID=118967 RepID=A0A1T4NIG9_9FIRM|nr:Holliday junction resolvase RecU [Anaerorhabdus furcosa]SJZ78925.1 recombination protein U [Anaerorhabdus furcosa]